MNANQEASAEDVLLALAERPHLRRIEPPLPAPSDLAMLLARAGITDQDPERLFALGFEKPQRLFAELITAVSPPQVAEGMLGPEGPLIAALPSTSINAQSSIAPDGRALIVVNQGVEAFLYNFMRVFATEPPFADEPAEPALDRAQKIQRLAQLMEWAATPMAEPRMRTFPATPRQREFASRVTTEAARFVVAHEFAHVFLHHHASAGRRSTVINGHRHEVSNPSWQQEYDADRSAMNMLLQVGVHGKLSGDLPFGGVELLFSATGLLEEVASFPDSQTHPPAADRLRALLADLEQSDAGEETRAGLTRISRWLATELNEVRNDVLQAVRDSRFQTELALEDLLDQCTIQPVPDYERFARGIEPLLNDHPAPTLAAMRTELQRLRQSPPASAEALDSPARRRWRLAFNFALAAPPYIRVALDADDVLSPFL